MRDIASFYLEIGRRIKAARAGVGLTQETLASRLGLTRTSITNIEKGRQKILLHTFCSIAAALGVSAVDLLPDCVPLDDSLELDVLLKAHPKKERDWIKSAIASGKAK